VGDSHAAALAPGLDFLLNGTGVRGILFARSSCPPLLRFRAFDMAHQTGCAAARKQIFTAIMSDPRIDTVVLAARWTFYLERSFPDNGEGGRENGPNLDKPTDEDRRFLAESLKDTVRFLLARHMKVVIVYPIPEAGWDVPLYLAKANMRGMTDVDLSVSASWVARRNAASAAMLDALGSPPGLYRIRPRRKLCDRERCLVARDGAPLYFDGDHPTAATAAHILEDLWLIRSL
jgi:hypothetical protein